MLSATCCGASGKNAIVESSRPSLSLVRRVTDYLLYHCITQSLEERQLSCVNRVARSLAPSVALAASLCFLIAKGVAAETSQTISFGSIADRTFSPSPFAISATASSGLTVVFAVSSGPAVVSGNNVTLLGSGVVTITASQPGNSTYSPAPPVGQTFTVIKVMATAATGGTITRSGDYLIHTFTGNGTFTVPTAGSISSQILLIGGGGGGRQGGGGGGGFRFVQSHVLGAGSFSISVGTGGIGGEVGALSGGNSSFGGVYTARGGGGGGGGGASGGGADYDADGSGGSALYGDEGFPGGGSAGNSWSSAGGGGGAGGPGGSGGNLGGDGEYPDAPGGNGGIGRISEITGSAVYYGGGGGGSNMSGEGAIPSGGLGGGGAGTNISVGGTGTSGLGGGGGARASGGAGVVIVRYFSPLPDTTPPTAPTALASPAHSSTSVSLAWTAATDDFSVVAYDVYRTRGGVTNVLPPSTSGTTFTDTHVQPGLSYSYFIRARDAVGNVSAASNSITVTTDAVADADSDGVPDSLEVLFGSQGNPPAAADTNLTLRPHRPLP